MSVAKLEYMSGSDSVDKKTKPDVKKKAGLETDVPRITAVREKDPKRVEAGRYLGKNSQINKERKMRAKILAEMEAERKAKESEGLPETKRDPEPEESETEGSDTEDEPKESKKTKESEGSKDNTYTNLALIAPIAVLIWWYSSNRNSAPASDRMTQQPEPTPTPSNVYRRRRNV